MKGESVQMASAAGNLGRDRRGRSIGGHRWCAAVCLAAAALLTGPIPTPQTGGRLPAAEPKPAEPGRRLYLDEFRPEPRLKVHRAAPRRAKYACVNMHTHPAALSDDDVRAIAATMDASNVALSISLDGRAGLATAEHLSRLQSLAADRYIVFVRMDPVGEGNPDDPATWDLHRPDFGPRMADRLTESVRLGAAGLKLLKDLGLVWRDRDGRLISPDDPRFDPVWERAGELGIPVLWHCADPLAFFDPVDERNERWEELSRRPEWSFHGGDYPSHRQLIEAQLRVIGRHPETRFICAHMANLPEDLARLGECLERYPNMSVETSARIAELGRQPYTARDFFLKYADRILFGSDGPGTADKLNPQFQFLETRDEYFPYVDDPSRFPPQGFWRIYGIRLPDDVLRKVYFENALRLLPGAREQYERRTRALQRDE